MEIKEQYYSPIDMAKKENKCKEVERNNRDEAISAISQIKDDLIKIDNASFQLEYIERIEVFLNCAKSICKPEVITEEERKSILKLLNIES